MAKGRPPKGNRSSRPGWAQRIEAARTKAGFNQESLGKEIGRSQSAVTDYETGNSEPDFATIERIAAACGVSAAWLGFGVGDPDEGNAFTLPILERRQHDRLFAFAFCRASQVFVDEGFQADLAYLGAYTLKLLRSIEGVESSAEAEDRIRQAMEAERLEIRRELDQIRKKRI